MPRKFSSDTWDPGFVSPVTSGPGGKGETWPPVGNAPVPVPKDPLGIVPNINKGYKRNETTGTGGRGGRNRRSTGGGGG